jgi:hypothetical protein
MKRLAFLVLRRSALALALALAKPAVGTDCRRHSLASGDTSGLAKQDSIYPHFQERLLARRHDSIACPLAGDRRHRDEKRIVSLDRPAD